jgi:hypothetical protein
MAPPGYLVSVETETGGIGVVFDHGHGSMAYSHGHQSHHADRTAVAVLAPRAGGKGVAVMRSFTGGVPASIGSGSDGAVYPFRAGAL